jgi:hypothetical protein
MDPAEKTEQSIPPTQGVEVVHPPEPTDVEIQSAKMEETRSDKGSLKEDVPDDGDFMEPPMREIKYSKGIFAQTPLAFNPVTSLIGLITLWGLTIW